MNSESSWFNSSIEQNSLLNRTAMAREFLTLPDELQALANKLWEELTSRGYRLVREPDPLELPSTPTIKAVRDHETHYFLVRLDWAEIEVDQWHRFACSCPTETRVSICCPKKIPNRRLTRLHASGIGLCVSNNEDFFQQADSRDLAFHAKAPDRSSLKPKVRRLLGASLDRLDRGDWRPAFEDACGILEEECRAYLLKNQKMGRVKFISGTKVKVPSPLEIRKMTLGALRNVFCSMVSQNHIEANLCSALTKLTPDRNRRTHKKRARNSEAVVRKRVGTHFWLINNALSLLV
jgi:hypothetical protein